MSSGKEELHHKRRFGDGSSRVDGVGGEGARCASKRGSSVTQKVQGLAFTEYMVRSWARPRSPHTTLVEVQDLYFIRPLAQDALYLVADHLLHCISLARGAHHACPAVRTKASCSHAHVRGIGVGLAMVV